MHDHGIEPIDLVVVNLYPFEEVRRSGADYASIVENIDIGGPAMVRASAKNHAYVAIVTDPEDYASVLNALELNIGSLSLEFRQKLAAKAFARTAAYDAAISGWFAEALEIEHPTWRAFGGRLESVMRYGENPHQTAGFYVTGDKRPGVATATPAAGQAALLQQHQRHRRRLRAGRRVRPGSAPPPSPSSSTPIPAASPKAPRCSKPMRKALACDPVSAFGGIVALNRPLDAEAAEEIVKTFTEVIIAPDASDEAQAIIAAKKNLRLLVDRRPARSARGRHDGQVRRRRPAGPVARQRRRRRSRTEGGDQARADATRRLADLKFAFRVAKHVKSNAIVYAKDGATVGIGAGQMSRVDSSRIAARKASTPPRPPAWPSR